MGFIVGFGLLAALILVFPLIAGGLLALTPAEAAFGVPETPRAAGALAPVAIGMGFLVGAGLAVTGFFV